MTELTEVRPAGEIQERGLADETVRRGVLKRFLPASVGSLAILGAGLSLLGPNLGLLQAMILGLEAISLTFGFALGLTGLKRLLYSDAAVDGRRSVVAGLCSPLYLGLVSIFTQGHGLFGIAALSTLVGAGIALAMFFPWLSRTPELGDQPIVISDDRGLQITEGPDRS